MEEVWDKVNIRRHRPDLGGTLFAAIYWNIWIEINNRIFNSIS